MSESSSSPRPRPARPEQLTQVRVSSVARRGLAALLDGGVLCLLTLALDSLWLGDGWGSWTTSPFNPTDRLVDLMNQRPEVVWGPLLVFSALFVAWSVATTLTLGATPGQRLLGLEARSTSDSQLGPGRSFIHALLAIATTLMLGLGPLWALADPARRTLYDRLSGVVLIRPS